MESKAFHVLLKQLEEKFYPDREEEKMMRIFIALLNGDNSIKK